MSVAHWDLLTGSQTTLMADAAFVAAGATSDIRERPFCSVEHGDVLPFVCFSPAKEMIDQLHQTTGSAFGIWTDYPVYVAIFQARESAVANATVMQLQFALRQAARSALWRPRVLFPAQHDAAYDPHPVFDLGGLVDAFVISLQLFTFRVDEVR